MLSTGGQGLADRPCAVGLYGQSPVFVVLTREEEGLRYRFADGHVGDLSAPEANVTCAAGAVLPDRLMPPQEMRMTDTVFDADGVPLVGRLIEPPGADAATPLIVYAQGFERLGWLDRVRDPYQMVGRGLSVFVYGKRGTGASGGRYSQNTPRLAGDLLFAAAEARRPSAER